MAISSMKDSTMSNNSKLILRYSQYQTILDDYLSLPEFNEKASETMRGKCVAVTSLCNYLGDAGIINFAACTPTIHWCKEQLSE